MVTINKNVEKNKIVEQENFVSYCKVPTCKDGIIEIPGLRDVNDKNQVFTYAAVFLSIREPAP